MRTSILGVVSFDGIDTNIYYLYKTINNVFVHKFFEDLQSVKENTEEICKTTHADPRCLASCIAVTTAVSNNYCISKHLVPFKNNRRITDLNSGMPPLSRVTFDPILTHKEFEGI